MGGAVSISAEKDYRFQNVANVVQSESKTDTLFDKIARRGHEVEHINHKNLGKTNDTLCITEVVLYIARANDPFFVKNFTIKPLLVTKEAFYYCFGTSTDTLGTDSTDSVEKQIGGLNMTRDLFRSFIPTLLLFSRLWQMFSSNDASQGWREGECIGFSSPTKRTVANWKQKNLSEENVDTAVSFVQFVDHCTKNIITPEKYFSSGLNAMMSDNKASDNAGKFSPSNSLDDSVDSRDMDAEDLTDLHPESPLNNSMSFAADDININHYSPINSVASIVIRSNMGTALPGGGMDECVSIDSFSNVSHGGYCLSVKSLKPLKPDMYSNRSMETSSALCSLYGVSIGGPKSNRSGDRNAEKMFAKPSEEVRYQDIREIVPSPVTQIVRNDYIAPRPILGWRELNKRREIIHHPTVSASSRPVFIVDDDVPASHDPITTRTLKVSHSVPSSRPTSSSASRPNSKQSWRRNKVAHAPLWKPRHTISATKKKSYSTVRTMKM